MRTVKAIEVQVPVPVMHHRKTNVVANVGHSA